MEAPFRMRAIHNMRNTFFLSLVFDDWLLRYDIQIWRENLIINWSVKKPFRGHKGVARSGLWASADIHCIQYKHSSEKKIQLVKLEKNQYEL